LTAQAAVSQFESSCPAEIFPLMKRFPSLHLIVLAAIVIGPVVANRAADSAPAAAAPAPNRFQLPATDDGLPGAGPIRRLDWFQKLWTEKRTGWAGRVRQDQGALVFLGDSITQGWSDQGSYFPGLKIANRGISGDTTRGVLIRLQEDVLALNPKGIVLLIGTNDIEEQAAPETIAGNFKLILAAIKQHNPALPVLLCNVFPSAATKKRPAEQIRRLNQLYFAAIRDEAQVTVLDTFALFANGQGEAKSEEFPDLLHPNTLGYAKWEKALRPMFESMGLAAAWPDDFTPEPGFTSLFNGRDLTGWSYPDGATFDGQTVNSDGRFMAKNGRVVVTVSRVERAYKRLLTTQKFSGDFVLKLEFRASPNADSGVFIRDVQLQCRDYPIAGPYFNVKNYRPLEWNELVVTVKGGLAHSTCNGEVLVDAMPIPATGPIGFESDRGQMEYRRIRVMEMK
jgi:lysophospholipase L1-like esterase